MEEDGEEGAAPLAGQREEVDTPGEQTEEHCGTGVRCEAWQGLSPPGRALPGSPSPEGKAWLGRVLWGGC